MPTEKEDRVVTSVVFEAVKQLLAADVHPTAVVVLALIDRQTYVNAGVNVNLLSDEEGAAIKQATLQTFTRVCAEKLPAPKAVA